MIESNFPKDLGVEHLTKVRVKCRKLLLQFWKVAEGKQTIWKLLYLERKKKMQLRSYSTKLLIAG
jgi:hypothetical protein